MPRIQKKKWIQFSSTRIFFTNGDLTQRTLEFLDAIDICCVARTNKTFKKASELVECSDLLTLFLRDPGSPFVTLDSEFCDTEFYGFPFEDSMLPHINNIAFTIYPGNLRFDEVFPVLKEMKFFEGFEVDAIFSPECEIENFELIQGPSRAMSESGSVSISGSKLYASYTMNKLLNFENASWIKLDNCVGNFLLPPNCEKLRLLEVNFIFDPEEDFILDLKFLEQNANLNALLVEFPGFHVFPTINLPEPVLNLRYLHIKNSKLRDLISEEEVSTVSQHSKQGLQAFISQFPRLELLVLEGFEEAREFFHDNAKIDYEMDMSNFENILHENMGVFFDKTLN